MPYCPEMAIGLGTPRPSIRLVGNAQAPRTVAGRGHGLDVTGPVAGNQGQAPACLALSQASSARTRLCLRSTTGRG
jgi:uncharacterized protein YbbK (DUF523 family)